MIIRLFLVGLFLGFVIIGLMYLLSLWQGGGDDWRDDDEDPEGPGPMGKERELPADESRPRELHDADTDDQ